MGSPLEARALLKLWGRRSAFNVQKALWALGEVGIPFETIERGGRFGGLDEPAFLALNPNGRVPVIEDDGAVVWESNAIVRYLAARYGADTLQPAGLQARAIAGQWMDWTQTRLHRPFMDLFWGLVRTPPPQRQPARLSKLEAQLYDALKLLDRRLANRPYLAGNTFSLADIPAGTTLYRTFEMEIDRPPLPHVEAWYRRLCARPAYQAHVMRPFDDLRGRLDY